MSYFKISDKFSGEDKKETIGYLDIEKKQLKRKKENKDSRVLDNYYNPNIHKRAWIPNGQFIRKKLYEYADSGLGHHYEKNNVEQKRNIYTKDITKNKANPGTNYIEFEYLEENQFKVTIEYCANCEEHKAFTRHSPELFKNYATRVQQCINLRFPFISVILKPIDTDILQEEEYNKKLPKLEKNGESYQNRPYINEKFKDVRIGAFEIQITKKNKSGIVETALIHSKLRSGKWPKINKVLEKIVNFLPSFSGEIHLFEKEENSGLDELDESNYNSNAKSDERKEDEENLYNSKLFGIQVNIYLLRNERINQIIREAENDIEIEMDPKRKVEQMQLERKAAKESPFAGASMTNSNMNFSRRIESAKTRMGNASFAGFGGNLSRIGSAKTRIESAKTRIGGNSASFMLSNTYGNQRASSAHPMNRPKSGSMNNFSGYNLNQSSANNSGNFLSQGNEKQISDSLKGTLLITKYTDREGVIKFGPIPYDSYYVEVVECQEFKFAGSPLTFTKILPEKEIFKKYMGLLIQDDSFLQIHVYQNKVENDVEEQEHIKDAYVTVQTYFDGTTSNEMLNRKEVKLSISESRTGIFEHMVEVGKYLVEVTKKGYETVRKVCDFEKGLNCINIEMVPCRKYCFRVKAFNLVKFFTENKNELMKNCEVFVYKSSSELLLEGVTDKEGQFMFTIDEDLENLSIIVSKMGYRPVQRVFIKTKQVHINENNEYEQIMNFYLVKESYFERTLGNTLILTYCNLLDENFSIDVTSEVNTQNLTINQIGSQNDSGVYCLLIQYDEKEQGEENEKENENGEAQQYEEIMPIILRINSPPLLVSNDQELSREMNGIEKYSCQTIIYTKNNSFFLPGPQYCEHDFAFWNIGWLDAKNSLFYEINTLNKEMILNNSIFDNWLDFIQKILDDKLYENLFEYFNFDKFGILNESDRYIVPEIFEKRLGEMNICGEDSKGEIERFITEAMKTTGGNVSYHLFKKKIITNIKNFKDDLDFSASNPMGFNDN